MLVLGQLARNWWVFVLRGLAAVLFGVVAFVWPGITLTALVLLFAFWALLDGVLALIGSVGAAEAHEPWWPLVFMGLLGVAAGLAALRWPGITALALLFVIAYWSILRGILEIVAAVRMRQLIPNDWWLGISGVASIAFGVLLVMYPASGLLAIVWLIGIYAVIFGITQIMIGFRLKGMASEMPAVARAGATR
jgi:uncharacterized membrane protein HdeD (DUF308 family)